MGTKFDWDKQQRVDRATSGSQMRPFLPSRGRRPHPSPTLVIWRDLPEREGKYGGIIPARRMPFCPDCPDTLAQAKYHLIVGDKVPVWYCKDSCGWWRRIEPGTPESFQHAAWYRQGVQRARERTTRNGVRHDKRVVATALRAETRLRRAAPKFRARCRACAFEVSARTSVRTEARAHSKVCPSVECWGPGTHYLLEAGVVRKLDTP